MKMIKEAFLLCGGKGKRFGQDKRFIKINGKPMYEHQLDKLNSVFENVGLLCKMGEEKLFSKAKAKIYEESEEDSSLLCGLISGLSHTQFQSAVFLSVDIPLIPIKALTMFRDYPDVEKVVIPVSEGKPHPGFGIYPKRILEELKRFKEKKVYKMSEILNCMDTTFLTGLPFLDEYPYALYNINFKKDVEFLNNNCPEFKISLL